MKIEIVNTSEHKLPNYETLLSAGMDLRAVLDAPVTISSLERILIKTGLSMSLPKGYEAQVRPRSGLALKKGITVLNAPGTIDADYRGEVGVILINLSKQSFTIENGDRIAQMVIAKHERIEWESVDKLSETERATSGFGSTGIK